MSVLQRKTSDQQKFKIWIIDNLRLFQSKSLTTGGSSRLRVPWRCSHLSGDRRRM